MGSLPCCSAVSPQTEHTCGSWFRKLSMESWERHPQSNRGKYGENKLINNTYPMSGANTEGYENILKHNVGLE